MNISMEKNTSIVEYMSESGVKENIQKALGDRTMQFVTSVTSLVNANETLLSCDKKSIMLACLTAASLDLPINQNLGFAYIIPYKNKSGVMVAQFQMGYKGFIQLAQRSGQFKTINVSDVRQGEITFMDRLTGEIAFDWIETDRNKLPVVGYVAYMELNSGFKKSLFMTVDELKQHGLRFSQSMKKGYGLWKDDFDAMASKTVLKLLLAKYAPLTIEMQKAQLADQSVVVDEDTYEYVDNTPELASDVAKQKEKARIIKHIKDSETIADLEKCEDFLTDEELKSLYSIKLQQLEREPQ